MFKKLVGLLTVGVAGLLFSGVASAQIATTAHDFSGTDLTWGVMMSFALTNLVLLSLVILLLMSSILLYAGCDYLSCLNFKP